MTTLNFKKEQGCEKVYINNLGRETPEGEVLRVVVFSNTDGTVNSYEITYREGHFVMGNRKEQTTELPENITLQD